MLAALNKLGVKVFVATALVVVVALGGALFLTKQKADAAADQSIARALGATQSNIQAVLDGRYSELSKELRSCSASISRRARSVCSASVARSIARVTCAANAST